MQAGHRKLLRLKLELGHDDFDGSDKAKAAGRWVRRRNALGVQVELKAAA
ncbi:hypothetical protein ACMHYB_60440 [Sorangium sp. So ce1128]